MPNKRYLERTRQRHHAVINTALPVMPVQPRNCGDLQQGIISNLVQVFYDNVSKQVNFDHIVSHIPKSRVPIDFRNHRYDISVLVGTRVILIDVLNIPLRYWQNRGLTKHGESQE